MTPIQRFMSDHDGPQRTLAAALGISRPYLSLLVAGKKRPSLELAVRIERLSQGNVPVTSWTDTPAQDEAA